MDAASTCETVEDRQRLLAFLERAGSKDNGEVRNAFASIRNESIYLNTHESWPDYCKKRWGLCYQKIDTWIDTGCRPRSLYVAQSRPQESPKQPYVYFLHAESTRLVKVGVSTGVENRIRSLQCVSPVRLILLGTFKGGRHTERDLHLRFEKHRSHGEWFFVDASIVEFISDHCDKTPSFDSLFGSRE